MPEILTIIIPCYNSEKTLAQAVASIFAQHLELPFEVVIVDDGSRDGTWPLIQRLQSQHAEIRAFSHPHNLGGGAARNTAVSHSKGQLFFCLDSDDLLGTNMLQPMVDLLQTQQLDGVGIHLSKQFIGNTPQKLAYQTEFGYLGQLIPFTSLFEPNHTCALNSTFLITRSAFETCGGYPTSHGFDTQALAFRFLSRGLKAMVCPHTEYYHRVSFERSYFLREYEAGRASSNLLAILEEGWYLFSDETQLALMQADYHDPYTWLFSIVHQAQHPFQARYQNWLTPDGPERYRSQLLKKNTHTAAEWYWLGCDWLRNNHPDQAVMALSTAIRSGYDYLPVREKLLTALSLATGVTSTELFQSTQLPLTAKLKKNVHLRLLKHRNTIARWVRKVI